MKLTWCVMPSMIKIHEGISQHTAAAVAVLLAFQLVLRVSVYTWKRTFFAGETTEQKTYFSLASQYGQQQQQQRSDCRQADDRMRRRRGDSQSASHCSRLAGWLAGSIPAAAAAAAADIETIVVVSYTTRKKRRRRRRKRRELTC